MIIPANTNTHQRVIDQARKIVEMRDYLGRFPDTAEGISVLQVLAIMIRDMDAEDAGRRHLIVKLEE